MEAHFDKVFEGAFAAAPAAKRTNRPAAEERPSKKQARSEPLPEVDAPDSAEFILNARTVKQMAQSLEKKLAKNELMRAKHTDDPTKFMDSEIALHEDISRMKNVATDPALFAVLIENNAIPMFIQLLSHANMDIRMDVIGLLADMTDVERMGEMESAQALVEAIMGYKGLELLCHNLEELSADTTAESDEAKRVAIYHLLQIIENLSELLPESCGLLATSTPLLDVLLHLCTGTEMTENRLYGSEVLSIVVQASDDAAELLSQRAVDDDRLDRLLQCLAAYRKADPASDEEEEYAHNLFNTLCSALRVAAVQDRFRSLQGFELMLRCIKANLFCKAPALRVLDHATMGHARNCERVVELGGLKQLFPLFMGKLRHKKDKLTQASNDEHLLSVFASLSLWLPLDSKYDVRDRFQAKFLEAGFEKTDRLVELVLAYHRAMHHHVPEPVRTSDMDDDAYEAVLETYRLQQLDHGLYTLQQVSFVVAHLCQVFAKAVLPYVAQKLHVHGLSLTTIAKVLAAQADMMDAAEHAVQKDRLDALVRFLIDVLEKDAPAIDDDEEEAKN
ncbi:beta-catenin-like protein [Achlya hypogyna]|uniref:Beta-catenin-like protein n=1 Tax=Achlya hypogyna TaxID=1202772 RepID=A0A1V9YRA8_ACHHY|nr:beta-catenin-like protein [Achlya hypogyna]